MAFAKLAFKAGYQNDGSRYSGSGGWVDGDKVRFRQGQPEKIGGWQRQNLVPFLGTARHLHPWNSLEGDVYLGIGTHLKYYIESGGTLTDITPIRATAVLTGPFVTTAGSSQVRVNDAAHGARINDFVGFSGATAVGGITVAGQYQIINVIDGNAYVINSGVVATATATGGGTVTAAYQINTGLDTTVYGVGYGAGPYGGFVAGGLSTAYGAAADITVLSEKLRLWSADNYGQDLVFNPRDGAIYYWLQVSALAAPSLLLSSAPGQLLSSLPGAADVPAVARAVLVTGEDRKVFAFGCTDLVSGVQDRLLVRWSDTANPAMWTPLETNSAGGIRIPSGTEFLAAVETKQEILVWTDSALHSMQYIGAPYQYGIQRVGMTSLAGPNAIAATNDATFWMGQGNFYVYQGSIAPIACPVQDYVFRNINTLQAEKVCAGSNLAYNEVWWFYPSRHSQENDRYVVFNYVENVWHYGSMVRTVWIPASVEDYSRAAGVDGYVYYHDYGQNDGSQNPPLPVYAFIESGPVELGNGDHYGFAHRLIPDISFLNSASTAPKVTMRMKADNFPGGGFTQDKGGDVNRGVAVPVEEFTEQVFFRLRGRTMTFRVESNDINIMWRLGACRVDVRPDGRRA